MNYNEVISKNNFPTSYDNLYKQIGATNIEKRQDGLSVVRAQIQWCGKNYSFSWCTSLQTKGEIDQQLQNKIDTMLILGMRYNLGDKTKGLVYNPNKNTIQKVRNDNKTKEVELNFEGKRVKIQKEIEEAKKISNTDNLQKLEYRQKVIIWAEAYFSKINNKPKNNKTTKPSDQLLSFVKKDAKVEEKKDLKVVKLEDKVEEKKDLKVVKLEDKVEEKKDLKVVKLEDKVEEKKDLKVVKLEDKVEEKKDLKVVKLEDKVEEKKDLKVVKLEDKVEEKKDLKVVKPEDEVEEKKDLKVVKPEDEVEEKKHIKDEEKKVLTTPKTTLTNSTRMKSAEKRVQIYNGHLQKTNED